MTSAAALVAAIALSQPARALVFNFSTASGATLTTAQANAFQTAANYWSGAFMDNITINVAIGFESLGSNILGATSASVGRLNANQLKSALAADVRSADDAAAVASLPAFSAGYQLQTTSAQARALGFATTGVTLDGTIIFSSDYSFSESRDANGTIAGGTYDLVGVAEHEIGHLLGFESSIDIGGGAATLLDEYRYTSQGNLATSAGAAYFSLDGGTTNIANFSTGSAGDYQASHWAVSVFDGGVPALMDPSVAAGETINLTGLDLRAFDVLGYDRAAPVPEPASWATMILGFMIAGGNLRRKRDRQPLACQAA